MYTNGSVSVANTRRPITLPMRMFRIIQYADYVREHGMQQRWAAVRTDAGSQCDWSQASVYSMTMLGKIGCKAAMYARGTRGSDCWISMHTGDFTQALRLVIIQNSLYPYTYLA